MNAEQLTPPCAHHGEGPIWDEVEGCLRWVDLLRGDVLTLGRHGAVDRLHVGTVAAAIRPRAGGGLVVGVERGFALVDGDGTVTTLPELWTDPTVRMNDGACDPEGRFYCGSMAYDQRPGAANVYRLDADLTVRTVLDAVTISNGLEWSPDGSHAYYNDTAIHRISVLDYDSHSGLTNRRTFAEIPDGGSPDGLTVDSEGGVWKAIFDGGCVHRYTPDAVLDEVLEVPARKVTACAFGGEGLDELFITTSREGRRDGETPWPVRCSGSVVRSPDCRSGSSPDDPRADRMARPQDTSITVRRPCAASGCSTSHR
jgi:sugar lactone lactonase YvrE